MPQQGLPTAMSVGARQRTEAADPRCGGAVIGRIKRTGAWWQGEVPVTVIRVAAADGPIVELAEDPARGAWVVLRALD